MSLSKIKIIGFALGIFFLACFMDKELYGYEGEFHEGIVDATFEMMSPRYPNLPREYLKGGSTQPDEDRKKVQERFLLDPKRAIEENEKHKRDTTRINNNYKDAVKRYNEDRNPQERLNQGARILAKAFHYVSDQTEPNASRDFSVLMRGEFREIAQRKLKDVMAKEKQLFFNAVRRYQTQISIDPRDEDFVRKKITSTRGGLEARIKEILGDGILEKDKAIQEEAKNKIDREIWDYLVEIVATQNLMLEEFVKETKIESEAFSPPRPPQQASPLQTLPSVDNEVKVQEERCRQIQAALDAAFQAKDINRFRALVEQARVENCDFYQNAYNNLQNLEQQQQEECCKQIDSALVAASQAKDINRFRALVEQARVENCNFYQNAYNHLQQWERCVQINSALIAASQAKDINRFRALVEQARIENCDFYQNAYNHLRNWEQQLQHSAIQPQPPPRPPVQSQPPHSQPQSSPPPHPPTDNKKWIVWHDCKGPSFACVIDLSRTTEDELRRSRSGRKVTIFGVYNTEQEARRDTCGKITNIQPGGQFAAGTLGKIGGNIYCVKNFIYWDNREKRYKCVSTSN